MDINNVLKALCSEGGVSGNEKAAAEVALSYLKKYDENAFIKNNSVFGNFGTRESGRPHVLIDAHIDQIGFVVTYITDDGFLKISNCGGIDRRLLLAQQVVVLGKESHRFVEVFLNLSTGSCYYVSHFYH